MSASDVIAIVSVVIAGAALVLSWRAERHAAKATRETNDLQRRLLEIEEGRDGARVIESRRAYLSAQLIPGPHTQLQAAHRVLRIQNGGAAEAHDIAVRLDERPVLEHPCMQMTGKNCQEVRQVGPHSSFQYDLILAFDGTPPTNVSITWSDDSGEPGSYHTSLSW